MAGTRAAKLEVRRRAAIAMLEDGHTNAEVAEHFGVTERAVEYWRRAAREKGMDGLNAAKHPGPSPKLTEEQRRQLPEILRGGARKEGFATDLWTAPRVTQVIKRKFGVSYHPGHVARILRDVGCTRQKPERRAKERDDAAARQWQERDWPRVKRGPNRKS